MIIALMMGRAGSTGFPKKKLKKVSGRKNESCISQWKICS